MKRVLLVYYSQSGDVSRIASSFILPLKQAGIEIVEAPIIPLRAYPFPWRSLWKLISVFPECHSGNGHGNFPLDLPSGTNYDLVVLAYQIWFLAPSIPIQDFMRSSEAERLRDKPVITICVSRNMWHSGSQVLKGMLRACGARHLDNISVTHQGSALATLVSVPRFLLTGKRDRWCGIFPPARIDPRDESSATRLGQVVASKIADPACDLTGPLLSGMGAVRVKKLMILPELSAYHSYRILSRAIVSAGRLGALFRTFALALFLLNLLLMVFVGAPIFLLITLIIYPFLSPWLKRRAAELALPSGL